MEHVSRVIRKEDAELRTADGVEVVVAISKETVGSPTLWFGSFATEPGVKVPPHYHTADTGAYVVSGRAAFEIDGERHEVIAGEYLYVPKGVVHTEETVGNETAFGIFARDEAGGETVYLEQ
ncbi:MAG: cupin domain-containing protein [Actinomycetota bacterium]